MRNRWSCAIRNLPAISSRDIQEPVQQHCLFVPKTATRAGTPRIRTSNSQNLFHLQILSAQSSRLFWEKVETLRSFGTTFKRAMVTGYSISLVTKGSKSRVSARDDSAIAITTPRRQFMPARISLEPMGFAGRSRVTGYSGPNQFWAKSCQSRVPKMLEVLPRSSLKDHAGQRFAMEVCSCTLGPHQLKLSCVLRMRRAGARNLSRLP
jgi:hypothetical protein